MIDCAGSMIWDGSDIRYGMQGRRSDNSDRHTVALSATFDGMAPRKKKANIAQWVAAAMQFADDMSQAELARRLETRLRVGFDRSKVQKILKGTRAVSADEMLAIEEVTGFPAPAEARSALVPVPLVDWVSASKLSDIASQLPVEKVPLLAFADLGQGDFFATRVVGDSMDRLSPEGSIIIVDRNDKQLVGGKCYVFAHKGETTFKMYQADDPPYLAPYSTNPANKPIFPKKKAEWEIIGRVKRTVLDL
jgi:SOS-response transcriptional repressor LexA